MSKSIRPRYSGNKSKYFWKIINEDLGIIERNELYSLGVALQNLEGFVLKRLNDSLPDNHKEKK